MKYILTLCNFKGTYQKTDPVWMALEVDTHGNVPRRIEKLNNGDAQRYVTSGEENGSTIDISFDPKFFDESAGDELITFNISALEFERVWKTYGGSSQ